MLDQLGNVTPSQARLALGIGVLAILGWHTMERLGGDGDDPSMYFGGDWLLFRASGIAYVGIAVIAAAVLLMPYMNTPLMLLLVGLFAFWSISEFEEREDV